MGNDLAVIDRFLDIFSRYIDSGFGLISGDVGFLVKILIGIDVVLAALAWAAGEDEVIQAFAKKVLYVGFFAFILNNWNSLAQAIFKSFAALGLKATGSSLSYADFLRPGKLAQAGVQGADVLLAQIQRLSGFPEVFWNLSEIMLMALSWVVTLVAFFVLAIMLFLAVIFQAHNAEGLHPRAVCPLARNLVHRRAGPGPGHHLGRTHPGLRCGDRHRDPDLLADSPVEPDR